MTCWLYLSNLLELYGPSLKVFIPRTFFKTCPSGSVHVEGLTVGASKVHPLAPYSANARLS